MSTIAVPSTIARWPRSALATVSLLAVVLMIVIAAALTVGRPARTRTVVVPAAASAVATGPAVACHFDRAC